MKVMFEILVDHKNNFCLIRKRTVTQNYIRKNSQDISNSKIALFRAFSAEQ